MENINTITNEIIRKMAYSAFLSYKENHDMNKSLELLSVFTNSLDEQCIDQDNLNKIKHYFSKQMRLLYLWVSVYEYDIDVFLDNWENLHRHHVILG